MFVSLGFVELLLVAMISLVAVILCRRFGLRYHWSLAAICSAFVASLCTPADPVSMLLLFALLLAFYVAGSLPRKSTTATQ